MKRLALAVMLPFVAAVTAGCAYISPVSMSTSNSSSSASAADTSANPESTEAPANVEKPATLGDTEQSSQKPEPDKDIAPDAPH